MNVMECPSEDMQEFVDEQKIGLYKIFGLTPNEEIELLKLEQGRQRLIEEEAA